MRFADNGSVTGLPNLDRYALCLAGDCADMGGDNDSLWLERNQRGAPWIFKRDGDTLEIHQAVNRAQPDEKPQLAPAPGSGCLSATDSTSQVPRSHRHRGTLDNATVPVGRV